MDREDAVRFLLERPRKFGHLIGFEKLGEMHNDWIQSMVRGKNDETLQSHRGSYKTTCVSIALAILCVLLPNKRILFMRKTDDDIKEIISQVKKILASPQMGYLAQCIYNVNLKLTTDNSYEIKTNLTTDARGSAQLTGVGIGGSLTGKHYDVIFTDDIVNVKDRISKAERDRTRLIYQELQNIVNPGGRIFNTGTPWHPEDAFSLMPEPKRFDVYQTGMLSKEQIEELRRSMSPTLFAANYELRHIASENALFTEQPTFTEDESVFRDGKAHIDAAYGGEDYTALTIGRRQGDTLYLYGRIWQRHVDTVLDTCIEEAKRLLCAPILCETNGDKGYLAKEIQRRGYSAMPYPEKMNKYLKISTFLRKWWGNVVFLSGTDKAYTDQILSYTEDAEHDDAPDSAACIARYYDRRGDNSGYKSPFM